MQFPAAALVVMFLLAVLPARARSDDALRCATHEFAPYVIVDEEGLSGIEVEVLKVLGARLDMDISIEVHPWSRALKTVVEGKVDCIFSAFRTPGRMRDLDFTNMPLHVSHLSIYVHAERPFEFHDLDDLRGLRIGLVRGFATGPRFDAARREGLFTVVEATEVDQSFRMLGRKRVDAVIYNRHVGSYMLRKHPLEGIVMLPTPLTSTAAYIAFSKLRQLDYLVPRFDQALFSILADGTYRDIFAKYQLEP